MILFTQEQDGAKVLYIGLSETNVATLLGGAPVVLDREKLVALEIADGRGFLAMASVFTLHALKHLKDDVKIACLLTKERLERRAAGNCVMDDPGFSIYIWFGEDDEAMYRQLEKTGAITPETIVEYNGPPSSKPVSLN